MRLFDYDSGFSRLFRQVCACILLGLLWLVCCILIVPLGAGSAALYYTVEKNIIREEGHPLSVFWESFKENFKTATGVWLVLLALGLFLGWDFYIFYQMLQYDNPEGVLCVVIGILLALLLLTAVYAFSYIARFRDSMGRVLKNSFLLMLSHPLVNLKLVVVGLVIVLTLLIYPPLLLLEPGFLCWTIVQSMEKVFRRVSGAPAVDEEEEAADGEE